MWPFGKNTEERVKEAIQQQEHTRNLHIAVEERGGTVTFQGEVPNDHYKNLLRAVAQGVKGVKEVDLSQVRSQQPVPQATGPQQSQQGGQGLPRGPQHASQHIPSSQQATPQTASQQASRGELDLQQAVQQSQIAKAVLARLEANVELKDDPIDVLQTGRSVILRGAVDSQHEYNLAEKIARETEGVASVDASGLRIVEKAKEKYREALASQQQAKPQAKAQGYVNKPDEWHVVQSGETLSEIALRYYGDASRESYMKIARANGISDPDRVQAGKRLQIPM